MRIVMLAGWIGLGLLIAVATPLWGEDVPPTGENDLTHSATVAVSRTHQAWLTETEAQIRAGEFAAAIERLQSLLDAEPVFLANGSTFENSHAAAGRLLQSLPAAWLMRYEDRFGGEARAEFSKALQKNDLSALGEVADRFPMTQAGMCALRLSAVWHFDHGDYLSAAAVLETLNRNSTGKGLHPAEVRRWVTALSRLELIAEARRIAEKYQKELSVAKPGSVVASPEESPSPPPSGTPVWKHESKLPAAAAKHLKMMEQELGLRGFVPLASASPLIVQDLVIARHRREWTAYDRETGRVRWRKSAESNTVELADNPNLMANAGFQQMIARQLALGAFADRNAGTMSTDGRRIFAVLHDHAHDGFTNVPSLNLNKNFMEDWNGRRLSCSQLLAFDAATGKELWRVPEFLPDRDPALPKFSGLIRDPRPDVFYVGPPTPLGGSLYIIGQKDREIRLHVLSTTTGEVQWSLPLATAAVPLLKDPMRRRLASSVVFRGGLLLCPTGAGAIVAVDPHSRTCRWIARYPREDIPAISPGAWPGANRNVHAGADRWWTGWRDVHVIVKDDAVLFCSPESEHLLAVSLSTGKPLWKQSRDDGLFPADGPPGQVFIIGSQSVRCVRTETGKTLWRLTTPMPAGRGVMIGTQQGREYLLPLQAGGVLRIDPLHKTARRTFPSDSLRMGNLVAKGETIIGQTYDQVVRLAALKIEPEPPDDPTQQQAWANIVREAGRFREAANVLRGLSSKQSPLAGVQTALQKTLLAELTAHPERASQIAAELEPTLDSAEARILAYQALAEAEQHNGRLLASLEFWLKLLEQNPVGMMSFSHDPMRDVSYSRGIQGAIKTLLDAAEPKVKKRLEERLDGYRKGALNRRDPFAASRFARRFDQLKWGRELMVQDGRRTGIGQTPLQQQLDLWALTEAAENPGIQASAFRRLMEDRLAELRFAEAAFAFRQIQDRFPDVTFLDRQTVPQWRKTLPADSPLWKELDPKEAHGWPASAPRITEQNRKSRLANVWPVPITAAPGSLCAELDVWLEAHRKRLRFSGAGQRGFWELALPDGLSAIDFEYGLSRGWGVGPILILQAGVDLLGIAPFDDHGEPRPRVLWRVPMLKDVDASAADLDYRVHQPPPGFGEPQVEFSDAFEQTVAEVGPVTAGFVAYQSQGRLIAIEPATGQKLWSRSQLPAMAKTTGDAKHVLLIDESRSEVRVLRAVDGRLLGTWDFPSSGTDLGWWGSCALFHSDGKDQATFSLWDPVADRILWKQEAPAKTLGFRIDSSHWAYLTPDGELVLWKGATEKPLAKFRLDSVRNPTEVYAAADAERFYLAIAHPHPAKPNQPAEPRMADDPMPRQHVLAGTLFGWDRRTGKPLWQSEWGNWAFALDQPAAGPVLVLPHRKESPKDKGRKLSVIRFLDKRTGREVHRLETAEFHEMPLWSSDPAQHKFEIQTPAETVQFTFE